MVGFGKGGLCQVPKERKKFWEWATTHKKQIGRARERDGGTHVDSGFQACWGSLSRELCEPAPLGTIEEIESTSP